MTEYCLEATGIDDARWVRLPGEGEAAVGEWALRTARERWDGSGLEAGADGAEQLAAVLEHCAFVHPDVMPGFDVLLHLPDPRQAPLAVYLGDYESEGDPAAELAQLLDMPDCVGDPVTGQVTVPGLGTGTRSLCHVRDEEIGLLASLQYAWSVRERGVISVVSTAGTPERVAEAAEDLDRLCSGLRHLPQDAATG